MPVAIVNLGPTRADTEVAVRVALRAGEVLPILVRALSRPARDATVSARRS